MGLEFERVKKQQKKEEYKYKALEPKEAFCKILNKKITIVVEYLDYRGAHIKSEIGEIFCSNMLECYYENIKCKYSGISKFYPDPLEKNFNDEFYENYVGYEEFKRILKLREKYHKEKEKTKEEKENIEDEYT
ncbi:MAG: hypothetical protein ACP5O4_04955 [bacterium]|jgi:hypothetical protein